MVPLKCEGQMDGPPGNINVPLVIPGGTYKYFLSLMLKNIFWAIQPNPSYNMLLMSFNEFLVSPALISNLNIHKSVGLSHVKCICFWFYWMFYVHLSAHSLLAKLGWWGWLMRMRLAWKKSQKIHHKYYIKIRPEALGVRGKELDPNVAIIGTADLGKCRCVTPKGT